MALSRREVVLLGERLRDSETPSPEDLTLLSEVLIEFTSALEEVSAGLSSLGYSATTRPKTSGTIVEKLRRERHLDLPSIRDLADARIVRAMTLDEQDEMASAIAALWPGAKTIDRRERPSHGYRAVHIVPRIGHCQVEIQLRTFYQDTWAQMMESFGDRWGRAIRYGGMPDDPDTVITANPPMTPSSSGSGRSWRMPCMSWLKSRTGSPDSIRGRQPAERPPRSSRPWQTANLANTGSSSGGSVSFLRARRESRPVW
jgi:hypothetical protein